MVNLASRMKWTKEFRQTTNNSNTEILEKIITTSFIFYYVSSWWSERENPKFVIILVSEANFPYQFIKCISACR